MSHSLTWTMVSLSKGSVYKLWSVPVKYNLHRFYWARNCCWSNAKYSYLIHNIFILPLTIKQYYAGHSFPPHSSCYSSGKIVCYLSGYINSSQCIGTNTLHKQNNKLLFSFYSVPFLGQDIGVVFVFTNANWL